MLKLDKNTFALYAAQGYINPACTSIEEFNEDLSRISSIKRLLKWFHKGKPINFRLLINHFVVLGNVFNKQVLASLLFFRVRDSEKLENSVKTILLFLSFIREDEYELIGVDINIGKELRRTINELKTNN